MGAPLKPLQCGSGILPSYKQEVKHIFIIFLPLLRHPVSLFQLSPHRTFPGEKPPAQRTKKELDKSFAILYNLIVACKNIWTISSAG